MQQTSGVGWSTENEVLLAKENETELEYFPTMQALKDKYPAGVCVAVLIEGREGVAGVDQHAIGFDVKVLDTAEIGQVYATTNNVRIWTKTNGSMMTLADSCISEDPAVLEKLKTQDAYRRQ